MQVSAVKFSNDQRDSCFLTAVHGAIESTRCDDDFPDLDGE